MASVLGWLSKTRITIIDWFKYYVFFCKPAFFISVLVSSNSLVENGVLAVLISYLIENWEVSLPIAAAFVTAQQGLSSVILIILSHVADAYLGRFKLVSISTTLLIVALVMLYRVKHIALFTVVMMLIAIGVAAGEGPLRELLADQFRSRETGPTIDEERIEARVNAWWMFSRFLGGIVANLALGQLREGYQAMVSAIVMGVTLVVFMAGFKLYYHEQPAGQSPVNTFLHVFRNAYSKRHLPYPTDPHAFYKNDTNQLPLMPTCILFSRRLDKAAIIENLPLNPEEEQEDRKKLCQVKEVKEVKLVLRMVPMWAAFVIYSFIYVSGTTFFYEQASNLDDRLAKNYIVPISFFYFIKRWTSYGITFLCGFVISEKWSAARKLFVAKIRIGLGMACGCLACFAAWLLEVKRLQKLNKLVNVKDDTVIDMSIFLLTPQFLFLGIMEALAEDGLNDFLYLQVGEIMATYGEQLNEFAMGIGMFVSIFWLLSFKYLFADNINDSRLDIYYRASVIAGVVNLIVVYGFVSIFFYKDAMGDGGVRSLSGNSVTRNDTVGIQLEDNNQQVLEGLNGNSVTRNDTVGIQLEENNQQVLEGLSGNFVTRNDTEGIQLEENNQQSS